MTGPCQTPPNPSACLVQAPDLSLSRFLFLGMSSFSSGEKRDRGADGNPSMLQVEAVVQTLSQTWVVEELARRISPASGPEHAPFREAVRNAGLVLMPRKNFESIDAGWARCLSRDSEEDYKVARRKLHAAYAAVGEVANGGIDRQAFEKEVLCQYSYQRLGTQDDNLRARPAHNGLHRDCAQRIFYEGNAKAIEKGAKKAKELYNRTPEQVFPMPDVFLLAIDWAEGSLEGEDGEDEGNDAE